MKSLLPLLLLAAAACSSPTGYIEKKSEDSSGFSDSVVTGDLRLASFKGNSDTEKKNAELFAKFRSIEVCQELNKKYSHILVVRDRTFTKEVTQTTSSPAYYYGVSPYYGTGSYWGAIPVAGATQTTTDAETIPSFDVYFECTDKPFDARIALKNLSQSQVQDYAKDAMGAVQVDNVLEDSPNLKKLQKGDIILRFDDQRVGKVEDAYQASRRSGQKSANVEFVRDGKRKTTTVTYKDVTSLVEEAQTSLIKSACKVDSVKSDSEVCKSLSNQTNHLHYEKRN